MRPAGCPIATLAVMLWTVAALAAAPVERLPGGFAAKRGQFAFFSATIYTHPDANAQRLGWLSQFELLVTNGTGIADEHTRSMLQGRGSRLFLYWWTNGFYEAEVGSDAQDGRWRDELAGSHREWLLAPEPLASQMGPPAFYYNLAQPELVDYLCRGIAEQRARTGYDGVFLDYACEQALPAPVLELWDRTHPGLPYGRALIGFLRRLRELDPGIVVFTNQAHRSSQPIVAEADWDMTESAATSHAWGPRVEALDVWGPVPQAQGGEIAGTFFRGWPGQWGIEGIHRQIEARLLTTAPREGFVYLDYMRPLYRTVGDDLTADLDIEAVYYSYCAAALWGRAAFCSGWFAGREYDGPLYFADLGEPLGDGPRVVSGVAVREYERGLIALATEAAAVEATYRLAQCEEGSLYDLFSGRWLDVRRQRARIALAPSVGLSGTPRPSARVYLKTTRDR